MFPAVLGGGLGAIRAFVERFGTLAGVGQDARLRLNLVLEELFTNTVRHGYRDGTDAPVWITLSRDEGDVRVVYEDCGPPFNPYAWLAAARSAGPSRCAGPAGSASFSPASSPPLATTRMSSAGTASGSACGWIDVVFSHLGKSTH